jgi:predicted nucleic acid-binding protein
VELRPGRAIIDQTLDTQDSHHDPAVDEIDRADHQLLAPAGAYTEALIAFARAGRVKDARDAVAGMGITFVPLTASMAERAADLRAERDALRLPDALVLATAHAHDGSLITYDHRLAQTARQHPKA